MSENVRILVVDDEISLRRALCDFLKRKDYDVEMAANGAEAIEWLQRKAFDLVITDLMMPVKDGMAVLAYAKGLPAPPEVIIVTGHPSFDTAVSALREHGAHDYLLKPYDFSELSFKISGALEKKRLIRENVILNAVASIHEATRALTLAREMDELLSLIMDYGLSLTGAESGSIMLLDEKAESLVVKLVRGRKEGKVPKAGTTLHTGIAWWVAQHGEGVLIRGKEITPRIEMPLKADWDFGSAISLPLKSEETVRGVVNLNRSDTAPLFDQVDLRIAGVLAMQAGVAIDNTVLATRLKEKINELEVANRKIEETYRHLLQSEKLSTIGLMAGTVAHDINNPLSVISGRAQLLLLDQTDQDARSAQGLRIILEQVNWISSLVKNLSGYAGKSKGEKQPMNVIPCIEKALVLTTHLLDGRGIELERVYAPGVPQITGNANELEQVFMNLIQNAAQAMKGGGRLTIEVSVEDAVLSVNVRDTGHGIPSHVLDRIFEPFYTTKAEGEGTGLGLLICRRIVEDHNGTIEVHSQATADVAASAVSSGERSAIKSRPADAAMGTTFCVRFPACVET